MDEQKLEALKELFLFQLFTAEELPEIINIFTEKAYQGGSKIFSEKDKGDTMYIIISGSITIGRNKDGKEEEITVLGQGDFFGEISLFDYVFRTASATAGEDSVLLEIKREQFNKLFSQKPQIAAKFLYQMMCEMSHRLRKSNFPKNSLIF